MSLKSCMLFNVFLIIRIRIIIIIMIIIMIIMIIINNNNNLIIRRAAGRWRVRPFIRMMPCSFALTWLVLFFGLNSYLSNFF